MRLLGVELGRLRSRPAIVVILLATLLLGALLVGSAAYDTRPVSAQERATAEQLLERQKESSQKDYEDCLQDPESYFGGDATAEDCAGTLPTIDWFLTRAELDLKGELANRGATLMILLACVAILVGATFAGADWGSGSMSNQLLFEPRRSRVWLVKASAVALACTAAAAVLLALFWGALGAIAGSRGIAVSQATWTAILQASGRDLALVAGVALGGYALTMLLRHTVGTLGLLFGYAVVGEGLAAALPVDRMSQWSMAHNVMAWLHDGTEVYDESICGGGQGSCSPFYTLHLTHAAGYLGALLLIAVVVSVISFRRRDVP
jgi:ABC-2 type transport system permease protein